MHKAHTQGLCMYITYMMHAVTNLRFLKCKLATDNNLKYFCHNNNKSIGTNYTIFTDLFLKEIENLKPHTNTLRRTFCITNS